MFIAINDGNVHSNDSESLTITKLVFPSNPFVLLLVQMEEWVGDYRAVLELVKSPINHEEALHKLKSIIKNGKLFHNSIFTNV